MALPDVVIIGAGVVGAACAFYAAHAGLSVTVLERGPIAGEATATGQGNALASDKPLGPALALAAESLRHWTDLGTELGGARLGLNRTGAIAVAATTAEYESLMALAARQRTAGLEAEVLGTGDLRDREPLLAPGLPGGVFYPADLQVDPVRATAHLLRASGAEVRCGVAVRALELDGTARITGVHTSSGDLLGCAAVVNAAGVWAGEISAMAGTALPVIARGGFVLTTEALGTGRPARRLDPPIRHTVYGAGHVGTIIGGNEPSEASPVLTSVRGGAVLIGAGLERIGVDRPWPVPVLRRLAAQAVALFPFLAEVSAVRAHRGFRPDTPDRLPIIGPDPWVTGLFHACGHEGAGICLAPATGALTAELLTSRQFPEEAGRLTERLGPLRPVTAALAGDPFAFDPERFG